ncbi:c-type cytochrome [Flavobacterium gawalongense]|uniref:Cytochrome c n=1 Tax=Flavobacterium gawalongense TaxID=2594432 RepID=A0A553BWB3_9FLAO|nr:cytochrome c [Flavobacterium gawalongense]TRX09755.1 cytochrome c [Flavobacterium gawalongense]TRX12554.1 cytochrome c [Flavobacterium gawalongense]TRX26878.1 cytochrome c [Flavobacterium gawalongense]
MLTTKLFLGVGLFLLGNFSFENPFYQDNYIVIAKANKDAFITQKIQTPGKEIFADFCIQCHGANGKGDAKNFPPLDGSDWLTKKRTQSIHAVKFGQSGEIIVNKVKFNNSMPPMGLSDKEVADVMNYIMTSWGNKQTKLVTEKEVSGIKK